MLQRVITMPLELLKRIRPFTVRPLKCTCCCENRSMLPLITAPALERITSGAAARATRTAMRPALSISGASDQSKRLFSKRLIGFCWRGGVLRGLASATSNFIRLYIFRRGFLCGAEGFLFCLLVALECFFRYAIIRYDRPVPGDTMVKR